MAVKRFKCNECSTSYATKHRYEVHIKTHNYLAKVITNDSASVGTSKNLKAADKPKSAAKGEPKRRSTRFNNSVPEDQSDNVKTAKSASAADDALKAHMSTKVLSLFDGSSGSKKVTDLVQKKTRSSLSDTSPLSASGIRSMSLSIKKSLDKFKNKTVLKKSDRGSAKKVAEDVNANNLKKALSSKLSSAEPVEAPSNRRKSIPRKSLPDTSEISQPSTSNDVQPMIAKKQLPSTEKAPPQRRKSAPRKNLPDTSTASQASTSNDIKSIATGKTRASKASTGKAKMPVKQIPDKSKRGQKRSPAKKVISKAPAKRAKKSTPTKVKIVPKTKKGKKGVGKKTKVQVEEESEEDDKDEDFSDDNDISYEDAESDASSDDSFIPEDNVYTCAHCSKKFTRKYHLDRHLRSYPCSGLPAPKFTCELCNREYTRKDNLREHLRTHTGEGARNKKYKCSHCDKGFHGMSLLMIHERKHTGEKPFECDFCPKKFPSAGALTKHRRTHTGEKPFACHECGFKFALKGTLNRHLRVHSGIRPHTCPYCSKKFIQIGGLKAHLFYHTGENAFKCEECGKIFNRKARLQMHQLYVHIKSKPFECEHCSKAFTRKEDLNRHAILHTGQKPYKCPTCGKSFAIKPSLKLHLLTHTKEEPRSCHECGRAFIRKDCLLRHMRKRHRDLLDKILLAENDEKFGEPPAVSSRMLSEQDLCENIQELMRLLVEESTLVSLGWPTKPVHEVLEAVIRRCGHTPVNPEDYIYIDRMRENAKLLFTVVIDDNAVKTLLNNQTVDEVILHVLRLAKT